MKPALGSLPRPARSLGLLFLILLLAACSTGDGQPAATLTPAPTAAISATTTPPEPSVPTSAATPPATPTAEEYSAAPTPVPAPAEIAPTSPPPTEEPPAAEPVEYAVQSGDSLLKLALEFDVPIAAIQLANDLGERLSLQAGQTLTIPAASPWQAASPYWIVYQVEAGDTLSSIGASHNLDVAELQDANQLADNALLSIGQMLVLPLDDPVAIAQAVPPPPAPVAGAPAGDGGTSSSSEAPAPPPAPAAVPADGLAAELFRQINATRAAYGLYPLAYNNALGWAAQLHAEDCRQRGWCSHTGSDGSNAATRILRAGYPAEGTAECWIWNLSPLNAVQIWMNESPPNDSHRRTLLSTYLSEVGIGIASTENGTYIIADFGRPAN